MSTTLQADRRTIRIRMPARLRKTVLLVHIVSAVGWIGIDIVMAMLIFTAMSTDDSYLKMINYGALAEVIFWPLIVVAVLSLVSGLLLGWSSKYGVARYWWVLTKLILNVVLATLVIFALRTGLSDAGEYARGLAAGGSPDEAALQSLLYPPIVSTTTLLFSSFLGVFKPWGRIRRRDR